MWVLQVHLSRAAGGRTLLRNSLAVPKFTWLPWKICRCFFLGGTLKINWNAQVPTPTLVEEQQKSTCRPKNRKQIRRRRISKNRSSKLGLLYGHHSLENVAYQPTLKHTIPTIVGLFHAVVKTLMSPKDGCTCNFLLLAALSVQT